MSHVNPDNYVMIQGWMLTELGLKGTELMLYAIIFGFSQENDSQAYAGSLQYLADWTNTTRRTVISSLNTLVKNGLITKHEETTNGVRFCEYSVADFTPYEKFSQGGMKNFHGGDVKKLHGGGEKISPNNIADNLDIDNLERKEEKTDTNVSAKKKFVPPTSEEVEEYCQEMGYGIDPDAFIDHYTTTGWMYGKTHMKDWKSAVRTWERRRKSDKKTQKKSEDDFYERLRNA